MADTPNRITAAELLAQPNLFDDNSTASNAFIQSIDDSVADDLINQANSTNPLLTQQQANLIGLGDTKKQSTLTTAEAKKQLLGEVSQGKKTTLDPNYSIWDQPESKFITETTADDVQLPNPNEISLTEYLTTNQGKISTQDATHLYNMALVGASDQELADLRRQVIGTTGRGAGDAITDAALSIAKTPTMIGETVYGLANFATGGNLENATGIGALLTTSREWINSQQSDQTQYQREAAQKEVATKIQKEMEWLESRKKDGANSVLDIIRVAGSLVKTGAVTILDNPAALQDSVLETALAFAIPAGFGAAVRKRAMDGLSAADRTAVVAGTATGKIAEIERNVRLASLAGIAAMEAGSNAIQGQQQILGMSHDDLMKYEKYRNMLADGVDPELAKQSMAADHFFLNYGLTALGAAAISRITGSDEVTAMLSRGLNKPMEALTRPLRAGATEFVEEFGQSGFGELSSNVANLDAGKDGQQLITPEIATAAGQGAITGGISGGAIGGISGAANLAGMGAQKGAEKLIQKAEEARVTKAGGTTALAFNQHIQEKGLTTEAVTEFFDKVESAPELAQVTSSLLQLSTTQNLADPAKKQVIESSLNELNARLSGTVQANTFRTLSAEVAESNPDLVGDADLSTPEGQLEVIQNALAADNSFMERYVAVQEEEGTKLMEAMPENFQANRKRLEAILTGQAKAAVDTFEEQDEATQETVVRRMGSSPKDFTPEQFNKVKSSAAYANINEEVKELFELASDMVTEASTATKLTNAVINQSGTLNGEKWRGVNHFISGFSNAMKKGNIAEASKVLADLNRWYQTRPEKLQDAMGRQSNKWTQPRADFINAMVKENTLMSKAVEYMSNQLGSLMVDNGISEQLEALASQQVFNPSQPATQVAEAQEQSEVSSVADSTQEVTREPEQKIEEVLEKPKTDTVQTKVDDVAEAPNTPIEAPNISEQAPNLSQGTDTNVGTTISDQPAVTQSVETDMASPNEQDVQAQPASTETQVVEQTQQTLNNSQAVENTEAGIDTDEVSEPTVEAPKGTTTSNKGKSTFFDLVGSYSESVKTTMNRFFRPVVSKAAVFSQNSDQLIEAALSKKPDSTTAILELLGLEDNPINRDAARTFKVMFQSFSDVLTAQQPVIKLDPKDYTKNSLTLFTQDGKLDNKVVFALTSAFMTEVLTNGDLTRVSNTNEQIAAMLGKKKDDHIEPSDLETLRHGALASRFSESIGKRFMDMMGMSFKKDSITAKQYAASINSFGLSALVTAAVHNRIFEKTTVRLSGSNEQHILFRRPTENLRSGAKKIIEENGSRRFDMLKQVYGLQNDFYTALTGATDLSTKPLLEKPEKVRGTVASSNPFRKQIRVPKSVLRILKKHAQIEQTIHLDMFNSLAIAAGIDPQQIKSMPLNELRTLVQENKNLRAIAGIREHTMPRHKLKYDQQKAANESIERELFQFLSWIQEVTDEENNVKPFYFQHEVWSNGRIGLVGNWINPQSSKFIRHFIGPKSFSVKTGKGKPSFLMFQKAVLQAFGGKSNEWDVPTTEAKFEQLYNRDDVQRAIQMLTGEIPSDDVVLEKILQGEWLPNTETEHPTQAYHALVALSSYREADGKDFTTSLPYEIDGKTNGTAHAILGFMETGKDGESLQDYLERVGIYTNTSRFRNFGEFVDGGGKDHYVLFGNGLTEAMNDITADIEAGIAEDDDMNVVDLKALNTLVSQDPNNSTVKRGLVKQALMVLIYGASPYNVTRAFANSVIEEIYDTISVDLTQLDKDTRAVHQLKIDAIKKSLYELKVIPENTNLNELYVFDDQQTAHLLDLFGKYYQPAIEATLNNKYPNFIARRDMINEAANQGFNMFHQYWVKKYYEKLEEVNKVGLESGAANFVPHTSLNKYQVEELIKSLDIPVIPSYFWTDAKQGLVPVKHKRMKTSDALVNRHVNQIDKSYKYLRAFDESNFKVDTAKGTLTVTIPWIADGTIKRINEAGISQNSIYYSFTTVNKNGEVKQHKYNAVNNRGKTIVFNFEELTGISKDQLPKEPTVVIQHLNNAVDYDVKSTNLTTSANEIGILHPSVSAPVLHTHSLDAANQLLIMDKFKGDSLNVHDAMYYNIDQAFEGGKIASAGFKQIHEKGEGALIDGATYLSRMMGVYQKEFGDAPQESNDLMNQLLEEGNKVKSERVDLVDNLASVNQFAERYAADTGQVTPSYQAYTTETIAALDEEQAFEAMYQEADRVYRQEQKKRIEAERQAAKEAKKNKQNRRPKNQKGSSADPLTNFKAQTTQEVDSANIRDIYDNIEANDPVGLTAEHKGRLDNLVDNMISPLMTKLQLMIENTTDQTKAVFEKNHQGLIIKLQRGSAAPTNFAMSQKETLVHELLHAIFEAAAEVPSRYKRRIEDLYDITRKYLKPTDLLGTGPHSKAELLAAQNFFDYTFNNQDSFSARTSDFNDRLIPETRVFSNGVHEFLAFGLSNQNVIKALEKMFQNNPEAAKEFARGERYIPVKSDPKSTYFTKAIEMINNFFSFLAFKVKQYIDRIDGLEGKQADAVLLALATKMAYVSNKHAAKAANTQDTLGMINQGLKKALNVTLTPVAKALDATTGAMNKKLGQGFQASLALANKMSTTDAGELLARAFNEYDADKDNFIRSLATEFVGRTLNNRIIHDMLLMSRKLVDTAPIDLSNAVKAIVREMFSQELTPEESGSLVRVALYGDLQAIHNNDTVRLENLVRNKKFRQYEMNKLKGQIQQLAVKNTLYIENMSELLAETMVKGGTSVSANVLYNAKSIALLKGIKAKPNYDVNQMTPLVDQLVSLMALDMNDTVDLKRVADIIARENVVGKGTKNGIQKYLDLHGYFKLESTERMFEGNDLLQRKGYVKEITNPNIGFEIVDPITARRMEKDGYRVVEVSREPHGNKAYMVIGETLALETYSRGTVSITGQRAKGTTINQTFLQDDPNDPNYAQAAKDFAEVKALFKLNTQDLANKPLSDLRAEAIQPNHLQPLYDNAGNIVNYRYQMSNDNRIEFLERADRADDTLGAMMGSILNKSNTQKVNDAAVDVMLAIYENSDNTKRDFIKVYADSSDPDVAETWRLLPEAMKAKANEAFGEDALHVRKEDFRLWFGQRKANLSTFANWVDKKVADTVIADSMKYITDLLRNKYVGIAEESWKELVQLAKERIVILSGVVLVGNVTSNTVLLLMSGMMNPKKLVTYQKEGYEYLRKFQEDTVKLQRTIVKLSDQSLTADERKHLEATSRILENRLTENPVRKLMDRGAYQSIIDDVNMVDEQFSYGTKLERRLEPITSKIPDVVKDIGNTVFMTQASASNKFLRDATAVSDFVARYALHKHNTVDKGMSFQDSFDDIMDSFINYELPTHKTIAWANDVGLLMFTKFFFRIQKVLLKKAVKNPASIALWLFGLDHYLGNPSDVYDTFMSPTTMGNRIYGIPPVLEQLTTIPITDFKLM